MPKTTITQLQRRALFLAIRPAAQEVGEEPEAYRRRILREELGVEHLADVSRGSGFDKLMSRIWQDRGDYARALDYETGSFSRLKHLIVKAAERIVSARPDWRGTAYDYIAGVMRQAGMIPADTPRAWCDRLATDSGWSDLTEPQLRRLLLMLQTHIRRHAQHPAANP